MEIKWCTYSWWGKKQPRFIGQAENITRKSCDIRYTKNQKYPIEPWDISYVKIFDTLDETIQYMIDCGCKWNQVKEQVQDKWIEDSKSIDWDKYIK